MKILISVVLLGLASASLASEMASQQTPASPQLEVTVMTGKLQIETPGRQESVSGQNLPYIRPGSTVRVVSGMASFESDYHADIRATGGDAFQFNSIPAQDNKPARLRIMAVESEPKGLDVRIGSEKFQIRHNGDLSIASSATGELSVRCEGGEIHRVSTGELSATGAPKSTLLKPGEPVLVKVPEEVAFESSPVDVTGISVSRKSDNVFEAENPGRQPVAVQEREQKADKTATQWNGVSRPVAQLMIDKYGPPDDFNQDQMTWDHNGPWKKTVVYREAPAKGGVLEQTVDHDVTAENAKTLSTLDIGLQADPQRHEISSMSSSEGSNFLAINLAHDVITGSKTPAEAKQFYDKTVSLQTAGKYSPYTSRLMFTPSGTPQTPQTPQTP